MGASEANPTSCIKYLWSYLAMEQTTCACRGVRSCLLCETPAVAADISKRLTTVFFQCHRCGVILTEEVAEPDLDASPFFVCSNGSCGPEKKILSITKERTGLKFFLNGVVIEGVTVVKDFVSRKEERDIVAQIDAHHWAESQSGRRKQVCYIYKESFINYFVHT